MYSYTFSGTVQEQVDLYDFIIGWDVDIELIYDDDGTFTSYDSGIYFDILNTSGNPQYGADYRGSWMNETITDEFNVRFDSQYNDQYAILNWDPSTLSGTFEYETSSNFVRGTLTAGPVPIPGALWLLGSGLLGLVGIRRKTKRS